MSSTTPSWPVKLATLVFSGGLAIVTVARAGLAGCDVAEPAPEDAAPRPPDASATPRALDFWGDNDLPRWPGDGPNRIEPDAWFHIYTLDARLAEQPAEPLPPRYFGGAKSDPDMSARTRPLPANYFGGAKSDADVWGGLTGTEIGEAYGVGDLGQFFDPQPRKQPRKKGRR